MELKLISEISVLPNRSVFRVANGMANVPSIPIPNKLNRTPAL
jgi:hypothetical protein